MYAQRNGRPLGPSGLEDVLAFEGSLGIAPIVVAAIPVAIKLVGIVAGLFRSKHPSPEQLAKAEAQGKRYIENYAEEWARGDRLRIAEIKGKIAYTISSANTPDYFKDYMRAALQTINNYDAQNPSPPAYTGALIVGIVTDAARYMKRPLYLLPKPGDGYTQVGTIAVKQPDGTTTTVPMFTREQGAPITAVDTASQESVTQAGTSGGGTFAQQAGMFGGSGPLLVLALAGTAAYFLLGGKHAR